MDLQLDSGWRPWLVWSAVWVGALSALAVGLVIGLIGYAIGAHQLTAPRTNTFHHVRILTTIFNVVGAFFAFVVGGWVAARFVNARRAEAAILHGVVAWLLTIPAMLLLAAVGAGSMFGGWYGGLVAGPVGAALPPMTPELALAVRNSAVAALLALLLGLVGSVLGGWLASGEPMTWTHHRRRDVTAYGQSRRAA